MLYIKFFHLFAMVSWTAGLFYLPRLFVYHADCTDTPGRERFVLMEKKLYWYIMLPAMLLTVFFGFMLLGYGISGKWIIIKLLLVLVLLVFHFSLHFYMKKLSSGAAHPSARFFRLYNEIPTVLIGLILFLAVVKPL